jgi:hypothetical protein
MQGGYDPGSESDSDICLNGLDDWITSQKNRIYDKNIKNSSTKNNVLLDYTTALEEFAFKLCRAIHGEHINTLASMGWPNTLIDCLKDSFTKTLILDQIHQWLVTFPFVKSRMHLKELEECYRGVNAE